MNRAENIPHTDSYGEDDPNLKLEEKPTEIVSRETPVAEKQQVEAEKE